MDSMPSDALRKLSRNIKAVAALSLLYFSFINSFGPTLKILGNDIPAPAIRLVVVLLLAYHIGFLLWQRRSEVFSAKYRVEQNERTHQGNKRLMIAKIKKHVVNDLDLDERDLFNLAGVEKFRVDLESSEVGKDPDVIDATAHLHSYYLQDDLNAVASAQAERLTVLGHIWIPCIMGAVALLAALWPDTVSWIGDLFDVQSAGTEHLSPVETHVDTTLELP